MLRGAAAVVLFSKQCSRKICDQLGPPLTSSRRRLEAVHLLPLPSMSEKGKNEERTASALGTEQV